MPDVARAFNAFEAEMAKVQREVENTALTREASGTGAAGTAGGTGGAAAGVITNPIGTSSTMEVEMNPMRRNIDSKA